MRKIRIAISPRLATSTFEKPATTGILCRYGAGRSADGRTHGRGACDRGPVRRSISPATTYWATALFAVAMATDWFDGWLARRSGSSSAMGSLLDPVADKILVLAVLIVLLGEGVFAGWVVAAIVAREFLVSGLQAGRARARRRPRRAGPREAEDLDAVGCGDPRRVRRGRRDRRVDRVVGADRGAGRDLGVRARLRAARATASPQPGSRLADRSRSATRR